MIKSAVFLILVLLMSVDPSHADRKNASLNFRKGNLAYEAGKFQEAFDAYNSIVEGGEYAAPLFFNLGNAAYRLGNLGEAALWYRRALTLDPTYSQAKQNLRVVENRTGFVSASPNLRQRILELFSRNELYILLSVGFWGMLLSVLAIAVFRSALSVRGTLCLSVVRGGFLLIAMFSVVALILQNTRHSVEKQAVVVSSAVTARTGPFEDAGEVTSLPPGTRLAVLSRRGSWSFVGIGDSVHGWIRSESLRPLWPYDLALLE